MLIIEPKHEKKLVEMETLNHNLGKLLLMGKNDEKYYRDIIRAVSAFAISCQDLLYDDWLFSENVTKPHNGAN